MPTLRIASAVLILSLATIGIASTDPVTLEHVVYDYTHRDEITMVVKAEWQNPTILYWKDLISQKYSDAVVVVTHGATPVESTGNPWMPPEIGDWHAYPSDEDPLAMKELLTRIREHYGPRRIVLIACNPAAQYLDMRYVTYALDNVYFYPDAIMDPTIEGERPAVGCLEDFVEQS